jgi:hypothetical protein
MIIKYFGNKKKDKDQQSQAADGGEDGRKIEFIKLVEPFIQIMSRYKENGVKLTALCIMAVVNMCNYSEDVKDMFIQKNGFHIIYELLESKDEDVLLNTLKLVMTLITKKAGDTTQIGRDLADANDQKILHELIHLVNEETGIPYTHFSNQVYFMLFSLLRAFIQHSPNTRNLIMADKGKQDKEGKGSKGNTIIATMMDMIHPKNFVD